MASKLKLILISGLTLVITLQAFALTGNYPYRSESFGVLLDDSYRAVNKVERGEFYAWMNQAYHKSPCRYPGQENLEFEALLARLSQIAAKPSNTLDWQINLISWLHKLIKVMIPKFSLSRGFEFSNMVTLNERQCLSQSILMAAILQRIGLNAGVVMVFRNPEGQESNNGHAVVLVKLISGYDIMLDASHKEAFARHLGIMAVCQGSYHYFEPVFKPGIPYIIAYQAASNRTQFRTALVEPLDYDFVRSQVYFYRGERTPGGLVEGPATSSGLSQAINLLHTSVSLCPRNPLAVYFLSMLYQAKGNSAQADALLRQAYKLYQNYGWIPAGVSQRTKGL